jgi:hypothetical protein
MSWAVSFVYPNPVRVSTKLLCGYRSRQDIPLTIVGMNNETEYSGV